MATPNLALVHIAAAQNQKEVTANAAFDGLDLALTNFVVEAMADANFPLPLADALGNMVFIFTGNLTATRGVTVPSTRKLYIASNQTSGSPVHNLQFGTAASPVGRVALVPPGKSTDYAILYCDGTNVDIVASGGAAEAGDTFSVGVFVASASNAQVLLYLPMDRPALFQSAAPNSLAQCKVSPTASTTYTLKKNGTAFATVTFAAGKNQGLFSQSFDTIFNVGDILEIDGPATADGTIAGIGITLQGVRY